MRSTSAESRRLSARHERNQLRGHAGAGIYLCQPASLLLARSRQRRCRQYAAGHRRELRPHGYEYIGLGEQEEDSWRSAISPRPPLCLSRKTISHRTSRERSVAAADSPIPTTCRSSWAGIAERVAVRAIYGFLAPTGRFAAGAKQQRGSGYWTHALSSGQTFYLKENKRLVFSAFQMYEFHTDAGRHRHPSGRDIRSRLLADGIGSRSAKRALPDRRRGL